MRLSISSGTSSKPVEDGGEKHNDGPMNSPGFDSDRAGPSDTPLEVPAERASPTLIVGLGNPGDQYATTRHNIGFLCVDSVAERASIKFERAHRLVAVGEGALQGSTIVVAKPSTYVNESGQAARWLLRHYDARPQNLLVVYDDMNLQLGKLRLRPTGSAGGHNGMKSIIRAIGTNEFPRLRIGIGRPPQGTGDVEYVLGRMPPDERKAVDEAVERAAEAVACLINEGIIEAMNQYN